MGFYIAVVVILGMIGVAWKGLRDSEERTRYRQIATETVSDLLQLFYFIYPSYAEQGRIKFVSSCSRKHLGWGKWKIIIEVKYDPSMNVPVQTIVIERLLRLIRENYSRERVNFQPVFAATLKKPTPQKIKTRDKERYMSKEEATPLRIVELEEANADTDDYSGLLEEFGLNQDKAKASWICAGGLAKNVVSLLLDILDPDLNTSTRILGANTDTQQFSEMFRKGTKKPRHLKKWAARAKDYGFRMLPLGNEGGAGGDPEVAKAATEATEAEIRKSFEGSRIRILLSNTGGGTGSGAAPVISRWMAEDKEMASAAVVMTPFGYQGEIAFKKAQAALKGVTEHIPALVIRNQALYEISADSRYKKLVQELEDADTGKAIDLANQWAVAPIVYGLDQLINHPASSVNRDPKDFRRMMRSGKSIYMGLYRSGEEGAPTEREEIVEQLLNNPFLAKGIVERAKIGMILFTGFLHEDTGYIAERIIDEMKAGDETKQVELMPGYDSSQDGERAIFFMAVAEDEPNFEAIVNPEGLPKPKARRHVVMRAGRAVPQGNDTSEAPPEKLVPVMVAIGRTHECKMQERDLPPELAKSLSRFAAEFKDAPHELKKGEWNALRGAVKRYLNEGEEMTELQLLTFTNENKMQYTHWPVTPYLYLRYKEVGIRVDRAKHGDWEGAKADFDALCEEFRQETGHGLDPASNSLFKNITTPPDEKSARAKNFFRR